MNNIPYIIIAIIFLALIVIILILIRRKTLNPIWGNTPKSNKFMFFMGIIFVVASAIFLLGNFTDESVFPTFLGAIGVIFIAASNFRLLK